MKFTPLIIITIILFGSNQLFAQKNISDLLVKLKKEPDSGKIAVYNDIFAHYQYSNPDSATYYLEAGLKYFTEKKYPLGIASLNTLLGYEDGTQSRMNLARKRHSDALAIFEQLHDKHGIGSAENGLGVVDARVGNYDDATRHLLRAMKMFQEENDTEGLIGVYLKIGAVNEHSGNLAKALDYYNKGLALERPGNSRTHSTTIYLYNNIGIVYAKMGDMKKGMEYFRTAMNGSNAPEYAGVLILSVSNMSIAFDNLNMKDSALKYANEAIQIAKDKNLPEDNARLMLNLASLIGRDDPKAALVKLHEAQEIATKIGHKALQLDIYQNMVEQYKTLGDYKNAFTTLEMQRQMHDSLFNIDKAKEIANLESVYELDRSNARVQELEAQSRRNALKRNIIITIAACLAVMLAGTTYFYRRTTRLNEQLSKREHDLDRSNKIKDKLFSIIGHDLRGPIGSIPAVLEILEHPDTSGEERKYLTESLKEHSQASLETLDKLLYWGKAQIKGSGTNATSFNTEPYIQNTLKLIKSTAEQKNISITDEIPVDTVIHADAAHFDFIIRNLVSNAVKFTHSGGNVTLYTDKNRIPGMTVFAIKDNGIGIEVAQLSAIFEATSSSTRGTADEKGNSIGLMLCKEFVNQNGGSIWVDSEKGKGSTFFFTMKTSNTPA